MRDHKCHLKTGITRSREFERKHLACFAVNCGLKCGHDCLYRSSGSVLRTHVAFRQFGENPFGHGYCIVDPNTPERVARDAARIRERGPIQLCTLTGAWAPEANKHEIGRRCLEAILSQPAWAVRILTKNAAVRDDFDLIEHHRDRVLVGLSLRILTVSSVQRTHFPALGHRLPKGGPPGAWHAAALVPRYVVGIPGVRGALALERCLLHGSDSLRPDRSARGKVLDNPAGLCDNLGSVSQEWPRSRLSRLLIASRVPGPGDGPAVTFWDRGSGVPGQVPQNSR